MVNHYKLKFKKNCSKACDFCSDWGSKSHQDLTPLDGPRLSQKMLPYKSLLLPCNFEGTKSDNAFLKSLKLEHNNLVLQIHIDDLKGASQQKLKAYHRVEVLSDGLEKLTSAPVLVRTEFSQVNLIVTKQNWKGIVKHWLSLSAPVRAKIKFIFLQNEKGKKKYLKCREMFKFHSELMKKDKNLNQKQFEADHDIYDTRVAQDMDLEASFQPIFENKINSSQPQLSIVIPSYNNKNEVLQTLKFLNNQTIKKEAYEIILVDDGSSDGTTDFIMENFHKLGFQINFKLIHYPRIIPRQPGDQRFRAGLARNVGVKQAVGEDLLFSDADIVFLKDSLEKIILELKQHSVVQIKRYYLNEGVKISHLNRSDFDIDKNSFHPNDGYWKKFYEDEGNWMSYRCPWKYICTFGLALKRKDFLEVGRFRKIFLNYGFEDTDLGYRLFRKGLAFKLSSVAAFHQFGKYERNEYSHSNMKRHMLLSNTAKIFYRHYVDPIIYKELPSFLQI